MTDLKTRAVWRKSTRSNNGGACVEVATNLLDRHGVVLLRDSKNPAGPVLTFAGTEWASFTDGVRAGEFSYR